MVELGARPSLICAEELGFMAGKKMGCQGGDVPCQRLCLVWLFIVGFFFLVFFFWPVPGVSMS